MFESINARLVYFDHNVLNAMVRGEEGRLIEEIQSADLLPVYSDVNLDEIENSVKRKKQFLDLYTRIGAWHLHMPVDSSFTTMGKFAITKKNPWDRLLELQDARKGYESVGTANLDFLSLMYGGGDGKLPSEIMLEGIGEAEKLLISQLNDQDINLPECSEFKKKAEDELIEIDKIKKEIIEGFKDLDERVKFGPLTEQASEHIGIGPIQLNNLKMPGVLDKIWGLVKPYYGPNDPTIDAYLVRVNSFNSKGLKTLPEIVSQVNGLYNLLNVLGYYRDEGLSKKHRMQASFSDMTHVGYAIACNRFYCDDHRMKMKAQAIYEHLGIKVDIYSSQMDL